MGDDKPKSIAGRPFRANLTERYMLTDFTVCEGRQPPATDLIFLSVQNSGYCVVVGHRADDSSMLSATRDLLSGRSAAAVLGFITDFKHRADKTAAARCSFFRLSFHVIIFFPKT